MIILVLGLEMNTMGSVTPSTAPPQISKGQANFPTSVKGKGRRGQDDERAGELSMGPLNGNVTGHKWILIE